MSLNLITDPWIPVRCQDGSRRIIAPWQMADAHIIYPDWPRPDFNVACLEFLIGLVYMAAPPASTEEWQKGQQPDPEGLKAKLSAYAPAFSLLGDGSRFLQDQEKLDGSPKPVDTLFIDSAGSETMTNNADVMVHRQRYGRLLLPDAAMALYTLQDFAPAGGSGYRTSVRGGGPLVILLDPGKTLWDIVWLNVPFGRPSEMKDLPWMRPTRTSEEGKSPTTPRDPGKGFDVEAFFGMPRRLRLVGDEEGITGVIQKKYGTNYDAQWIHPLSPYYRPKVTEDWRPCHPRAGRFGYRNWLGLLIEREPGRQEAEGLEELGLIVREWRDGDRPFEGDMSAIVAGWVMKSGTPRDFIYSRQPVHQLPPEAVDRVKCFIEAAEMVASMLNRALEPLLGKGKAREAQREEFFLKTEDAFYGFFREIAAGGNPAEAWLHRMRDQALDQFDALALPGLSERGMQEMRKIAEARKFLSMELHGYGKKSGPALFGALRLPVPETKSRKKGKAT